MERHVVRRGTGCSGRSPPPTSHASRGACCLVAHSCVAAMRRSARRTSIEHLVLEARPRHVAPRRGRGCGGRAVRTWPALPSSRRTVGRAGCRARRRAGRPAATGAGRDAGSRAAPAGCRRRRGRGRSSTAGSSRLRSLHWSPRASAKPQCGRARSGRAGSAGRRGPDLADLALLIRPAASSRR